MADQTVRVENMPNAGTAAAVALEMWKIMRTAHGAFNKVETDFELFDQCLNVARGSRYDLSKLT